mgnify:CR=1 FL=1
MTPTALLLTTLICGSGGSGPPVGYASAREAEAAIAPTLRTGSLLFSTGDCLAVRAFTGSPYTHVAIVVVDAEGATVYESINPEGVRKLPLGEYLARQSTAPLQVQRPCREFAPESAAKLVSYLESQLGRPYAVQHHLTGERCQGLHCAEYCTDALMAIDLIRAERPARVSPASLCEGVMRHGIYAAGETFRLEPPPAPASAGRNWCEQMWIDTKDCCGACCRKLSGWFLCR